MIKLLLTSVFAIISVCYAMPKLPPYVGVGYDVVVGNPKTNHLDVGLRKNVFQHTYNDGKRTEDNRFLVPDRMVARMRNSCSYTAITQQFLGVNSYQQSLKTLVDVSTAANGWLAAHSFSTSSEFRLMQESTVRKNSIVYDSQAKCEVYSLEMDTFAPPPLHKEFRNMFLRVAQNRNWLELILEYGTHYVTRGNSGARVNLQTRISRRSVQELTAMNINIRNIAAFRFRVFIGDVDNNELESNRDQLKAFENKIEETIELNIGARPSRTGNWINWYNEAILVPMPSSYAVLSLSTLISSTHFPEFNAQEISDLRNSFDAALRAYCSQYNCDQPLGTDPPFPPNATFSAEFTRLIHNPSVSPTTSFQDDLPSNGFMNVRRVFVHFHFMGVLFEGVTALRFLLSDSVNSKLTEIRGIPQGRFVFDWDVPEGEFITQVHVRFADYVRSLQFTTNRGTMSPILGSSQGPVNTIFLNGRLVGMRGNFSRFFDLTDFFDVLGFITTTVIFPSK